MRFDTDALRREHPLSVYLPARGIALKRNGREHECCCPFHAENTPSFRVYPGRNGTEQFQCFGCGAQGDVLDFVEQWDGVDFSGACEILGGKRVVSGARESASKAGSVPSNTDPYAGWEPCEIANDSIQLVSGSRTPVIYNPKRADERLEVRYREPSVHTYVKEDGSLVGHVLRIDMDGGKKLTPAIRWCRNHELGLEGWTHYPFPPEGRPLYRLPALLTNRDSQVLVLFGERKTDRAAQALPTIVCVSFQGGDNAAGKTDWSPLRGRDVLIWPDNDESGEKASDVIVEAAHAAGARSVRVILRPGADKPKGWDIGDAITDGMRRKELMQWARERAVAREAPQPEPAPPTRELRPQEQAEPAPEPRRRPPVERPQADPDSNVVRLPGAAKTQPKDTRHWRSFLELKEDGGLYPKLMVNFVAMLTHHPDMRGVWTKNTFSQDIILAERPPWETGAWKPRKITDTDTTRAASWLERMGLRPTTGQVGIAISAAAEDAAFDPVRDWLNGLRWDGQERLSSWLVRYMGVTPTKGGIEAAFGRRWLISAAARNLSKNPEGEKVDTMLVLEGEQGKRKSSALATLATFGGVRYFSDSVQDITNKDSIMQMAKAVIVELPEMVVTERASANAIKAWASRQVDSFRPPYGRQTIDLPRRSVLAGTINPAGRGYLTDPTGARRYWPVYTGSETDLRGLERDRDQLWAEAVALYKAGEQWWLTEEEVPLAWAEQCKRFQRDAWAEEIDDLLHTRASSFITLRSIYKHLNVPMNQQTTKSDERIVNHLVQAGYRRARRSMGGKGTTIYVRGEIDDDEIQSQYAAHGA